MLYFEQNFNTIALICTVQCGVRRELDLKKKKKSGFESILIYVDHSYFFFNFIRVA